jgi:hypothetical protein
MYRAWEDAFVKLILTSPRREELKAKCAAYLAAGSPDLARKHLTGMATTYDPEVCRLLAESYDLSDDHERHLKYRFMSGEWPASQHDEIVAWVRKHLKRGGFRQLRGRLPEPFWARYSRRLYSELLRSTFKELGLPAYLNPTPDASSQIA